MSQSISLIVDGALPREVEQLILTTFLGPTNLLKYRLVRKSAADFLKENIFKGLFENGGLHLCKSVKSLEIQFQYVYDRYPDKCWKVASCVFETGNLKFCASVLHEGWLLEVKLLEDEINRKEPELKKLWGDDYQDPACQCHQTWLEHTKTKDALGNDAEAFADSIVGERKMEFAKILSKNQPVEDTFHEIIAFDERLLPYANFMRHEMLKEAGDDLFLTLSNAKVQLSCLKNPEEGLARFKTHLEAFFHKALKDQIIQLINKQEPLTDEDCNFILSKFNVWINACAKSAGELGYAVTAYRGLTFQSALFQGSQMYSKQAIENAKKIKPLLYELSFNHVINLHAKKPLELYTVESFEKMKPCGFMFMDNVPFRDKHPVLMGLKLLKAIYVQHNLVNTDPMNPPAIPENIKRLTEHVFKESIRFITELPLAEISEGSIKQFVQKTSDAIGISIGDVGQNVLKAFYEKHNLVNRDQQNLPAIPADVTARAEEVYQGVLLAYAEQHDNQISDAASDKFAEQISEATGISFDTVLADLTLAIESCHSTKSSKKE